MSFSKVRSKALALRMERASAEVTESELRLELDAELSRSRGAALHVAAHCDISVQHVSDIRHGRRTFSDSVVERLGMLK